MICKEAKTKLIKIEGLHSENMEEVDMAVNKRVCPFCASDTQYVLSFLGRKAKCLKCKKLFIENIAIRNDKPAFRIKDLK